MVAPLIRLIARTLLRHEWEWLRAELLRRHADLLRDPARVPPVIAQRLLISAEDRRHGRHAGFDPYAMSRALWHRIALGRREGASTIEQQIVRVLTNRFEPTLRRKAREILLAALVAHLLPKSATPSLYLNVGYFGWRMSGFTRACRRLGLRSDTLCLEDAAGVVARLKYPEPSVAPRSRLSQIARRRGYLKALYGRHLSDGTYGHLGVRDASEALPTRSHVAEPACASS